MAALDIDAIYAALFARLQTELAGTVLMFTRRAEHWDSTLTQPALLLLATEITPDQVTGSPPIWKLGATIMVYVKATEKAPSPETVLLDLLGLIEAALQRKVSEARGRQGDEWGTNLGGLISSLHMGRAELTQGVEGGQAVLSLDLSMVAATPA
jgi:hypothetical protein